MLTRLTFWTRRSPAVGVLLQLHAVLGRQYLLKREARVGLPIVPRYLGRARRNREPLIERAVYSVRQCVVEVALVPEVPADREAHALDAGQVH